MELHHITETINLSSYFGTVPKTASPLFLGEWGKEGSEPGEFHAHFAEQKRDERKTDRISVYDRGHLYVVVACNHRVQKFAVE